MIKYVFDIEANGLLDTVTRMWILTARRLDTGEVFQFEEGDFGWKKLFDNADYIIGHHILGYDLPALYKLFKYKLPAKVNVQDTLIMSQVLNYKRFANDGHSLDRWGRFLGIPKPEHEDWSQFSEEMRVRNEKDVEINVKVYELLVAEMRALVGKKPELKHYMRAEHFASEWAYNGNQHGWPFDVEGAKALHATLTERVATITETLTKLLGTKTVAVDKVKGVVTTKKPKWTKMGTYDAHTCRWFDVDPYSGMEGEERKIGGEYCRVVFEPMKLSSVNDVKAFLYRHGWVPTEWNTKAVEGSFKKERTSPKITEDSLEFLGGDGKLYAEYLTAKSRLSIVTTWLANVDEMGMLHGDCVVIGTASMRTRHSIIVNVPSTDSAYGPEMRALFGSKPGWSLIGCDSAGNQARGLAHYLKDEDFIDTLLHGDIHQYNADILTSIVRTIKGIAPDFIVKRSQAKRILYAFLFGASGGKLWSYIFGTMDDRKGKTLKEGFIKAVPGFKDLLDTLGGIYQRTNGLGNGYIPSLVGTRIYVDSTHKLLVYLLQATEKITCATALMYTVQNLRKEGIPYIPCIFYHDEIDFMVPDKYAERAAEIGKLGFKEGPKLYGIEIMDGESKIGKTWYDVH